MEENRAAVTELFAFYAQGRKSKKVAVKGRDYYSLSYRYHGKVTISTDDTELVSEADSITFMPKGRNYETEIIEDTKMAAIHFKLDRDIDFRNPSVLKVSDKSLKTLFEKLARSFKVGAFVDFASMASFYELLSKLEAIERRDNAKHVPKKITLAMEHMQNSFSDPLFSISSLAESLEISTAYLRREFSRAYGKSPISFLIELRIGNAKNLLQSEYLSIEQIAKQCGFSSASYFVQVFHKTVGVSPSKYRQNKYY